MHLNHETSENNFYQKNITISEKKLNRDVLIEFDGMVNQLLEKGVNVNVFEDKESIVTPDSIFPNNWISTHKSGEIVLYPMYAGNRRLEVRMDIVEKLIKDYNFLKVIDFRKKNEGKKFLEGTGSMILDRKTEFFMHQSLKEPIKNLLISFQKSLVTHLFYSIPTKKLIILFTYLPHQCNDECMFRILCYLFGLY